MLPGQIGPGSPRTSGRGGAQQPQMPWGSAARSTSRPGASSSQRAPQRPEQR
ncbi:MAG TPA: hypothetical protein VFO07_20365 [Roseiflexaceae bacterium]|nr:hypothetical protein [Roseiflexaceae bacterium]